MDGILFADLTAICRDDEAKKLSPVSRRGYWETVSYETKETKGILISAKQDNYPEPLSLTPEISGWYRIYVGVVACINQAGNCVVNLKLDGDYSYTQFRPTTDIEGSGIEENFWKCADMTGKRLTLAKMPGGGNREECMLGWLRFEPMTDAEVEAFWADAADESHKKVYATNDMHCLAYFYAAKTQEEWDLSVQAYEQSDVEWLAVENVYMNDGIVPDDYSFNRFGDENVARTFGKYYNDDMLRGVVAHGHALGLKMCISQRMGEWCLPFPTDGDVFDNSFWRAHPEMQCVDRDGEVIPAMSYAFPEVRQYIISQLLRQAKNGFDAVQLMFHRGIPYVLFEKPFCDAFESGYGEDPHVLPWEDERIVDLRCEILTGLVRELRSALDDAGFRSVEIHVRGLHSVYDNRLLGIDPVGLAEAGLIDAFIAHPLVCREMLKCGDVWQDKDTTKVDVAKYTRYAAESNGSIIWRKEGFAYADSSKEVYARIGEVPMNEEDRIREWVTLEKKYGVKVYFEIMPRNMSTAEYRRRLLEIYEAGGGRVSFWDTYGRAPLRQTWNLIRDAGHEDRIRTFLPGPDGCSARHRFLRTGTIFNGRFRPNWGT